MLCAGRYGAFANRRASMQRVTITIDDDLMAELDRIIASRGYQNRSEAIRDLARAGIREAAETLDGERDCVAALVYVYDHAARQLPRRLTETFHDHHEMSLSSLHVHLDHDSCLEVTVLKGKTGAVSAFRRARHRRARRPARPRGDDAHGQRAAERRQARCPQAQTPAHRHHGDCRHPLHVMRGLVPRIHVLLCSREE